MMKIKTQSARGISIYNDILYGSLVSLMLIHGLVSCYFPPHFPFSVLTVISSFCFI